MDARLYLLSSIRVNFQIKATAYRRQHRYIFFRQQVYIEHSSNQATNHSFYSNFMRNIRQISAKRTFRCGEKPKQKFLLYHRLCDVIDAQSQSASLESRSKYLVELVGQADPTKTLVQIFQLFSTSIFENPNKSHPNAFPIKMIKKSEFNLMFTFAVEMYFLHSKLFIRPPNTREYLLQQIQDFYDQELLCKTQKGKIIAERIKQLVHQSLKKIDHLHRDWSNLQTIYKSFLQIKQEKIQQILNKDVTIKQCYFPVNYIGNQALQRSFADKILTQLFWIQFTNRKVKKEKFNAFLKHYKNYFKIEPHQMLISSGLYKSPYTSYQQNKYQGSFVMKRYAQYKRDEILINMRDLIKLSQSSKTKIILQDHLFQVAKRLIRELDIHHKNTKLYYPLLTPQAVLLNQLTLKVQLNYENILHQALGLLNKPMSIQQSICFNPTPSGFNDAFKAPLQYDILNQMKIKHFLFGFNSDQASFRFLNLPENRNRLQKLQLMKESQSWRCLLTISYIMNGKQWQEPEAREFKVKKDREKQTAQQMENKFKLNPFYYEKILGQNFMQSLQNTQKLPQYDPKEGIQFFKKLTQNNDNEYSITQKHECNKSNHRLLLQKEFLSKLQKIITKHEYFNEISNGSKYLLLFYLSLFFEFSKIVLLQQYYSSENYFKAIILHKQLYEKEAKPRDSGTSMLYISYRKIKEYQLKKTASHKKQMTEILGSYSKEYHDMEDYFQIYEKISKELQKMNENYCSKDIEIILSQFRDFMCNIGRKIDISIPQIKTAILKIVNNSFLPKMGFNQAENEVSSLKKQHFQLKIKIIISVIFQINQVNFTIIQSMIAPLVLDQTPQLKKREPGQQVALLRQQLQLLEYCNQMMNSYSADQIQK